jgi:soluble lytic murein transglycosylase-like protein
MTTLDYVQLAKRTAVVWKLDPALVCAVAERESSWLPYSMRFEGGFYRNYILPMHPPIANETEAIARATSWGLMQIMGETARELGFMARSLAQLCDPMQGLDWGARYLAKCIAATATTEEALLRWNGGGAPDYPGLVLANVGKYA